MELIIEVYGWVSFCKLIVDKVVFLGHIQLIHVSSLSGRIMSS